VQEVITLSVFVPFALIYMNEPFKLDYLWAGLCLVGAVYFIFRDCLIREVMSWRKQAVTLRPS
jgi:hypothetical protein